MFYDILSKPNSTMDVLISEKSELADLYEDGSIIFISAGMKRTRGTIHISDEPDINTILVSDEILSQLSICHGISCQVSCTKNSLKLGPVIGLLMFIKRSSIKEEALNKLLDHALLYNSIRGLLCVFSVDGIDFKANTVSGFSYNPLNHAWEESVFPFPDAIYRRVSIPKETIRLIQQTIDGRMYNSSQFNKLDFWIIASSSRQITEHVPMTKRYHSFYDLDEMLERYKVLFLKPVNSTRALGLMRVMKIGTAYSIQEKNMDTPELFRTKEEAASYIDVYRKNRKYLIQEGIDLLRFDNRYIDFRLIMQKDHLLEWQCTGIITSIGKRGGVCSNYGTSICMSFETFFDQYFSLTKREIFKKKQEMISLCQKACLLLEEERENYADLGIDVGLDKNLKPWIFEINNRRHEHRMTLFIDDYDAYYRAKTNPVKYGARLSGFDVL